MGLAAEQQEPNLQAPASHVHESRMHAGFTISIPHFNTTLSRVNRLEIAAVVEVLLSLRCCRPRNVCASCSRNLRLDIVHFVKHMSITDKDSSTCALPGPCV